MKVHFQRLTSLLLALVLGLGLLVFPASAAEEPVTSTGTFWSGLATGSDEFFNGYVDLIGDVIGFTCASVCPNSEDRLHHGKVISKGLVPGQWVAKCSYCSEKFTVYDDDMQNAYDSQVGDIQTKLGVTQVGTDGLYFYLTPTSVKSGSSNFTLLDSELGPVTRIACTRSQINYTSLGILSYGPAVVAPITGTYYLFCSVTYSSRLYREINLGFRPFFSGAVVPFPEDSFPARSDKMSSAKSFSAGSSLFSEPSTTSGLLEACVYLGRNDLSPEELNIPCYVTVSVGFRVVPLNYDVNSYTANIGGIDSRVGNLSGDYGIIGDNGTIIKSDAQYIVNETTNTYTNPSTGQTSTILDWTYDYGDRSYNLTLEGGSTTTVTYGDENVTIKEGDTTYNIYYIVQGGGSGGETPPPTTPPTTPPTEHVHKYTSTVTTEPTCVGAGLKTYTCSECGDTYTEKIPATGHSWTVDRTINTTYDEDGNVLTQGYTIYRCSVCGNEYKDETGSGPPDDGKDDGGGQGFLGWLGEKLGELLGAIGDGILGLIQAALGKILDGLIALVNMISEKLTTVVEVFMDCLDVLPGIFSGFTDFLTAGFAFLPPEVITVITFGILMMVLVAVVKLFLK